MTILLGIVTLVFLAGQRVSASPPLNAPNPDLADHQSGIDVPPATPSVRNHPSDFEFGVQLFRAKDYYRAITAFKRHAFFDSASVSAGYASYMIPLSEYAAGRFGEAVLGFETYSEAAAPGRLRDASDFYQGRCWDLLGEHEAAQTIFRRTTFEDHELRERAAFALAWSEVLAMEWTEAQRSMRLYAEQFPRGPNGPLARRITHELSLKPRFDQKRVLWGALFSVVPGGGQLYAGRRLDALNTFLMVGATATIALRGAEKNSSTAFALAGMLSVTFYLANLYGGANAVAIHNANRIESALQSFRTELRSSTFDQYILP